VEDEDEPSELEEDEEEEEEEEGPPRDARERPPAGSKARRARERSREVRVVFLLEARSLPIDAAPWSPRPCPLRRRRRSLRSARREEAREWARAGEMAPSCLQSASSSPNPPASSTSRTRLRRPAPPEAMLRGLN
jgi:hypothetical protein